MLHYANVQCSCCFHLFMLPLRRALIFVLIFFHIFSKGRIYIHLLFDFTTDRNKCYACLYHVNDLSWPSFLSLRKILNDWFLAKTILKIEWNKSHFSNFNHYANKYWRFTKSFLQFFLKSPVLFQGEISLSLKIFQLTENFSDIRMCL